MRYYVYVLLDPTDGNRPFYVGKGLDDRLQHHFRASSKNKKHFDKGTILGCDTMSILADATKSTSVKSRNSAKLDLIANLKSKGIGHEQIARVVAKRLDTEVALAVEACLIKYVYGLNNLCNLVQGSHADRFRAHKNWSVIPGFDHEWLRRPTMPSKRKELLDYYVYVLREPLSKEVFYVGKGVRDRLSEHFRITQSRPHLGKDPESVERTDRIKRLLAKGNSPSEIGRIVARVETESQAFAIEALLMKFVYGLPTLANVKAGHHADYFRSKDDWAPRKGFDLPFVATPGVRTDRSEKLDGMVGEGLSEPLIEVQRSFPSLVFTKPKVLDASELGIEAKVSGPSDGEGARIKVFIRRSKIQIELRHRTSNERAWIIRHFKHLKAYPLRRGDDVFFPDAWRGSRNMAQTTSEAIRRLALMLEIVRAPSRRKLSAEARSLLPGHSC